MIVELLVLGGMAAGTFAYVRRLRTTGPTLRLSEWIAVAYAAGVRDLASDSDASFGGTDGALSVHVDVVAHDGVFAAHVTIAGLAPEIAVEREGLGARLRDAVGARGFEVGDPDFDAELAIVASNPAAVRAILDAKTRGRLRVAFRGDVPIRIGGGALRTRLERGPGSAGLYDGATLGALVALAHRLEPSVEPENRLKRIVTVDPLAAVRAAALDALLATAPEHPRTFEALRAAVKDAEPRVRLRAARALGDEGVPVLLALATDRSAEDAVSAGAVEALGTRLPVEAACRAVESATRDYRVRTGVAAADVLASANEPAVEAALVAALPAPSNDLAVAAAHALGRCGTVGAIADLRAAEDRGGDVRRAAREAVAAIQSRLTGATPGQVSLADGAAGQVSVVDAGDGRVSLPAKSDA